MTAAADRTTAPEKASQVEPFGPLRPDPLRRGFGAAPPPRRFSFEFFPPASDAMETQLWAAIGRLAPLRPDFVSVTYGAGGTTRARTLDTVARIAGETALPVAAHLTCVAAPRGDVDAVARDYWTAGVRHIVALRGDPPAGTATGARYQPHPDGYASAADLVAGLKRVADFDISVAAYPEVHPEAASAAADIDTLKRKIDAGATRAITQFFFDPACFLRFVDAARAAGISVPIVPGILPITNVDRTRRFAAACGATIPAWIADMVDGLDETPDTRQLVAATVAAEQCRMLQAHGVTDFHFYTLNRAALCVALCRVLGIKPRRPAVAA